MKTTFFNPFEKYSEKKLILIGMLFTIIGTGLGFLFNARFDGVLDLHFVENTKIQEPLLDIIVDILSLSIMLFIAGKLFNSKTRFIDVFSVSMIARIPIYLLALFNVNGFFYNASQRLLLLVNTKKAETISSLDLGATLVFAMFTILFLIWYVTLLFNGFKTASNAKKIKHIVFFVMTIIIAEVLSKIVIGYI